MCLRTSGLHLRRGDHIVKPLAFLLTAVYRFNPFVWAAYLCMCTDLEMRCDEAVLGMLPAERRADYSMSLLSLSTGRHFALASPLAFGETGVKRRIQNVLSSKSPQHGLLCLRQRHAFAWLWPAQRMRTIPSRLEKPRRAHWRP